MTETLATETLGDREFTGSTAFVLAGGGTKGSFEVGALQYLVGTERIVPDIITATSAGAVAASVLAQARTYAEFAQRVQEVEDDILAMTRTEQIFGEQAWLTALEGTALGGEIRLALTEGTRPPLPTMEATGIDQSLMKVPDVAPPAPRSPVRAAKKARRRRRRKLQRMVAGAVFRLPRARRKFRTSGSAVLNLHPLAEAIRHGGPSGIHAVDPALVGRPGLQLRLAVTALRAGVLRYVTEDGTIVEDDAVTPAPGSARGPVDFVEGVIASASVPLVFPPRALADDDYVDGGVLQVVPVRAAVQLGATRIIAVVAIPLRIDRDERDYVDDNAANVGLRALGAIAMADRQRENLAVTLPLGATLTTIDPVIDVVGYFEVQPGLLRINKDYGWLRASDVMAEGDAMVRADIAAETHRLTAARLQAWHLEETIWEASRAGDHADAGTVSLLRELKRQVHDIVDRRKQLGFPVPDGCEAWWTGYEVHGH
jgi:predicted acylesterase/phospholipase RssA